MVKNATTPPKNWFAAHGPSPWVIAGPSSAESRDQVMSVARRVAEFPQVKAFRAGLWNPTARQGSFIGVGSKGLRWLQLVKEETTLETTTVVAHPRHVELCLRHGLDILLIAARTTADPNLVREIAEALRGCDLPIMVENPIHSELGLWLGAIERLQHAGIRRVIAIHRGFSVYSGTEYRNQPNWKIPIELKLRIPGLPLACDSSHIAGDRKLVKKVAQMAINLGIPGLMIRTHCEPDRALSEAKQQITPDMLKQLLDELRTRELGVGDDPPASELARLRTSIDEVDRRIILGLAERLELVTEIGKIKRLHDIPVLQLTRWEDLLKNHVDLAEKMNVDSRFIKAVFEIIHAHSVELQL